MNLIAIDPGKTTGWAVFWNNLLRTAGVSRSQDLFKAPPAEYMRVFPEMLCLIEIPRWYPHDYKDVNDLIDLAVLVGEIKRFYESQSGVVELVFPRTWKGTVPKDVHNKRVLAALSPEELKLVPLRPRARTPDHNCVDAIGLGLWKLGRM